MCVEDLLAFVEDMSVHWVHTFICVKKYACLCLVGYAFVGVKDCLLVSNGVWVYTVECACL
jgi:hypothetical protein